MTYRILYLGYSTYCIYAAQSHNTSFYCCIYLWLHLHVFSTSQFPVLRVNAIWEASTGVSSAQHAEQRNAWIHLMLLHSPALLDAVITLYVTIGWQFYQLFSVRSCLHSRGPNDSSFAKYTWNYPECCARSGEKHSLCFQAKRGWIAWIDGCFKYTVIFMCAV